MDKNTKVILIIAGIIVLFFVLRQTIIPAKVKKINLVPQDATDAAVANAKLQYSQYGNVNAALTQQQQYLAEQAKQKALLQGTYDMNADFLNNPGLNVTDYL